MIPKKIHYIWFGENERPQIFKKCLESWQKFCPDYEIVFWNESNFDVNQNAYCQNAYKIQDFTALCDYARIRVVHDQGGVYLDTDVEVVRSFDDLLKLKAFFGFQDSKSVNLGHGFGAESGHPILKQLMSSYEEIGTSIDEKFVYIPAPQIDTKTLIHLGLICNNKKQSIMKAIIFPSDFFSPLIYLQNNINITQNTRSIHHYTGTWLKDENKKRHEQWFNKIQQNYKQGDCTNDS